LFAAAGSDATAKGSETIDTNSTFMLASLQNAAMVARFAAFGIDITSAFVANSTSRVSLITHVAAATSAVTGERYVSGDAANTVNVGGGKTAVTTSTNFGTGTDDLFTLTVGGNSVTVSSGQYEANATNTSIARAIVAAHTAKYGIAGTASGSAKVSLTHNAGVITVASLDKGTAGNALAVTLSIKAGTVTATNAKNTNWVIGATNATTDNSTVAADVLLTMTVKSGSADVTSAVSITSSSLANMPEELTTTVRTNSTGADALNPYNLAKQPADAIAAEGASAAVADTTAAVSFSRVGWLG
jgi:hypothetical protein